jgi:hypothetical protein
MSRPFFALLAITALISGCSQAAIPTAGDKNQILSESNMLQLARQQVKEKESVVAIAESKIKSVSYAVFVTYSNADESNPATCRLRIIEGGARGGRVIEDTDHLLYCSTVVDAEIERKQLSVVADHENISIYEERDNSNSKFEFFKEGNDWVISKASFNYPEQSVSADIRVIHAEGAFPGSLARTRVSDFDASSANLHRTVVR